VAAQKKLQVGTIELGGYGTLFLIHLNASSFTNQSICVGAVSQLQADLDELLIGLLAKFAVAGLSFPLRVHQ
jgi:hypothetical protein